MDTKVTFVAMKTTKPVLKIGPEESLSLYKIWTHFVCDADTNKLTRS